MTSRSRTYTQTQPSEWSSHDDYNESLFDPQYADQQASSSVTLDHCRLYITNIPRGLNDEGLRTAFSKFGTLSEVYLSKDPRKKYGLIKFETPGEAKLAMMKMNKTEPLKLVISIAHKAAKKSDDRPRHDWIEKSNSDKPNRSYTKEECGSIGSNGRPSRAHDTTLIDSMTNGDNNMDDLLDDDYGFSDILDANLTLELENLKMEQLKVKEEQLQCKTRMLMLKQHERKPLHQNTMSNRCILPDGKIVVRNVGDRNTDLDVSAGAGDSRVPALQRTRLSGCVWCGAPADAYCSRCGLTPYCSPRCQARDWAERHRAVCHNLARLSNEPEICATVAETQPEIQNPAPLRRPRVSGEEERPRPPRRDDDTASRVSDKSNNDRFNRLQERGTKGSPRSPYSKGNSGVANGNTYQNSQRNQNQNTNKNYQQRYNKPKPATPEPEFPAAVTPPAVKPDIKQEVQVQKPPAPTVVPKTPQVNETAKPDTPVVKPGSLGDVTPIRKIVPKNYLIEQLSINDTVLLSVDAKAADCRSTRGDYVCLSMHEKFESDYQKLCEDYVLDCDADQESYKLTPGEACSYFNVEDGSWYRARCLSAEALALLDGSRVAAVLPADKIRKLAAAYENIPEFCCVLDTPNVEIGSNLKCCIVSKSGDGYKVTLENVDTGSSAGEGFIYRWLPTVEYPPAKPVIPEVPRPALRSNSRVLVVDATSLERAFVRPADSNRQREYDDIVQNVLLAGRKASPLQEPPQKGQTLIARYADGLHYRALCKRTSLAQNKYLLEYVEYGNLEICRNLEDMFPCPPNLDISAVPAQVSMIKLAADPGQLTPAATEYIEKLKDGCDEMILTLPNGESSAPSGSEATLKLVKNGDIVNKKIVQMCTPEWKKLQEKGGDVVDVMPLMYSDLEYQELPAGPVELEVLDVSVLEGGVVSACVRGDPHMDYVFNQVTQKMAEYCNSELGREPYLPKIEELCIAQFPPYPQWFRAVLMEQLEGAGGSSARVCYVDYGNIEVVPVSLLRKMLPEFVRGVPVVVSHLEIKDFPKEPTPEMIVRAATHLQLTEEGRGRLRAAHCAKQEEGLYVVDAPDLIKAMCQ